jgi:hypothetical protein
LVPEAPPPDAPPVYWRGDDADPSIVGRSTDAVFIRGDNGAVWLVPEGTSPKLFVNCSTERFYRSMALFQPAWQSLDPDEDATAIVKRVADDLRMIDERAFTESHSFWPLILEQVEDGLL